jgi:hypothetical protein
MLDGRWLANHFFYTEETRGSIPWSSTNIMSETGRYYITDTKTGRKFCVEPIGNPRTDWGDINPATKKVEGSYGSKYKGSIEEKDSIIKEEKGFKNIGYAKNPMDYINKLLGKE